MPTPVCYEHCGTAMSLAFSVGIFRNPSRKLSCKSHLTFENHVYYYPIFVYFPSQKKQQPILWHFRCFSMCNWNENKSWNMFRQTWHFGNIKSIYHTIFDKRRMNGYNSLSIYTYKLNCQLFWKLTSRLIWRIALTPFDAYTWYVCDANV